MSAGSGSGVSICLMRCWGWWCCWLLGREWDLPQALECSGEGQGLGPVLSQAEDHFALSVGDAGGDVQQPIPECLGFGAV